jgi:hypothetical protein
VLFFYYIVVIHFFTTRLPSKSFRTITPVGCRVSQFPVFLGYPRGGRHVGALDFCVLLWVAEFVLSTALNSEEFYGFAQVMTLG